ncbi:unnamed protein product [Mytilus coruscus]|uniref:Uncharacterized protein n=1 Tax=Mytilus coruscus TaxID=42192 RepID=A0A6J8CTT3_MYTCO|nr:unnamed protein product [Mytilus coruscus]
MDDDKWENAYVQDKQTEVFHNQQGDPEYSKKLNLIYECQHLVGNDRSGRLPLNIAVIGAPGCGKSSFLNTVFASFNTDSWREIAPIGFYKILGSQLHFTERFKSFTKKDYYRGGSKDDGVLLPTFLDMTGFPDENSKTVLDLLEMLFSGRIKELQKLSDFVQGAKHMSSSVNLYNKEVNHLPVDRIIVVSTLDPDSPLPSNLLCSIVEASRKNRDIPVYGVLTGRDKYNPMYNKKVSEKVTNFCQVLGLPKHRFAYITNYCEESDPDLKYLYTTIPQFDVPVLRFMKQVKDTQKIKKVKERLLENCKSLVGIRGQDKKPLTIAVIGSPGGGKSSFLNTVFAALGNKRWIEHAKGADTGETGKQITQKLKRFLKEDYYGTQDAYLMPTFLDMKGFEDEDTLLKTELLNIVLSGKMENGEKFSDIDSYYRKYGIQALRRKYLRTRKKIERVNRLIVVCSANPDASLPKDLFEIIIDVTSRNREITIYGVFTQTDKYTFDDPRVVEKERTFLINLGIPETRFARIRNYCPDVVPSLKYTKTTIPLLDIPVLRFMRGVLTPEPMDSVIDNPSEPQPFWKQYIATSETYRSISDRFGVTISSTHRAVRRCTTADANCRPVHLLAR